MTSPETVRMPAISLYQPWATWVANGWKTIETRTHNRFRCLLNQRIAIHAAKKFRPPVDIDCVRESEIRLAVRSDGIVTYPMGGVIVATATVGLVRELVHNDSSDAMFQILDGERLFGLFLDDVRKLDPPIPWRGTRGIFYVTLPADLAVPGEDQPW